MTWSLAKELYGPHGPYFVIPMGLLIGIVPTALQWLIGKVRPPPSPSYLLSPHRTNVTQRWPKIGPLRVSDVMLPIIYQYARWMSAGTNSPVTSTVIVGVLSQVWLRRYHPGWYKKYNYILGGALDGGAQVMIFILSFAVFGASGKERPFPKWAGNPAQGNVDYCNGNGALD